MVSSFYDKDYIIEANQKRLEEYNAALQKFCSNSPISFSYTRG